MKRSSDWTYHFGVDDNILFLEDLAKAGYISLFDQPYLAFWREMREKYGVRVQFNIHGKRANGFALNQVPDKFKSEWRENADWIRLTFHQMEDPDSRFSYAHSSYDEARRDYLAVTGEIIRFAGEELLSPFTTIHHAGGTREVCRAWRDCGVKGLGAGTWVQPDGQLHRSYYLNEQQITQLARDGILKDEEMGLYFFPHDVPLHRRSMSGDDAVKRAESIIESSRRWHHIEITHEEWAFEPSHRGFVPDARERVELMLCFLNDRGIKPVFLEEVVT